MFNLTGKTALVTGATGGIGGAMDLVAGDCELIIVLEHRDSKDRPKLRKRCKLVLHLQDPHDSGVELHPLQPAGVGPVKCLEFDTGIWFCLSHLWLAAKNLREALYWWWWK